MWLIPGYEHLSTLHSCAGNRKVPLNRTNQIAPEPCSHSVTLKDSDLFGTDWLYHPGVCLLGDPQWDPVVVWHKSLTVASIWVIGLLHPGFYLDTRENLPHGKKIANLPLLRAR